MAVSPLDLGTLSVAQLSSISRARAIIDAELRLRYDGQWPIKVRRGIIDFMFKENQAALDSLLEEYRSSGWNVVKYQSPDQGDWYSFFPS